MTYCYCMFLWLQPRPPTLLDYQAVITHVLVWPRLPAYYLFYLPTCMVWGPGSFFSSCLMELYEMDTNRSACILLLHTVSLSLSLKNKLKWGMSCSFVTLCLAVSGCSCRIGKGLGCSITVLVQSLWIPDFREEEIGNRWARMWNSSAFFLFSTHSSKFFRITVLCPGMSARKEPWPSWPDIELCFLWSYSHAWVRH